MRKRNRIKGKTNGWKKNIEKGWNKEEQEKAWKRKSEKCIDRKEGERFAGERMGKVRKSENE